MEYDWDDGKIKIEKGGDHYRKRSFRLRFSEVATPPWRQRRQTLHGAAQRSADGGVFGADEDPGGSA